VIHHSKKCVDTVRIVSFSGVDCSGKSTQISALMDRMRVRGEKPFYLWLRVGYTPMFCALKAAARRLLGRQRLPSGLTPERQRFMSSKWKRSFWFYAAFADMAFQTAVVIRVLRLLGYRVLCDRYIEESEIDLTMNFGGYAAQLRTWKIVKAIGVRPDVRIFLDLPFEESLRRSILKNEPFPDSREKRRLRADFYESLKLQTDYCVVDARESVSEISAVIDSLLLGSGIQVGDRSEVVR
jgi:thymidylate kinase